MMQLNLRILRHTNKLHNREKRSGFQELFDLDRFVNYHQSCYKDCLILNLKCSALWLGTFNLEQLIETKCILKVKEGRQQIYVIQQRVTTYKNKKNLQIYELSPFLLLKKNLLKWILQNLLYILGTRYTISYQSMQLEIII